MPVGDLITLRVSGLHTTRSTAGQEYSKEKIWTLHTTYAKGYNIVVIYSPLNVDITIARLIKFNMVVNQSYKNPFLHIIILGMEFKKEDFFK